MSTVTLATHQQKYLTQVGKLLLTIKKSDTQVAHDNRYCMDILLTLTSNRLHLNLIKGALYLVPKISMFCALSQNYQYLLEK